MNVNVQTYISTIWIKIEFFELATDVVSKGGVGVILFVT